MNLVFAVLLAALCSKTIIVNDSKHPWNSFDQKTLNRAKIRCGEIYPNSPCVKWFRKYNERDYQVVCGASK